MPLSNLMSKPVRTKPVVVKTRILPAAYPAGRGVNQPSGKIKVTHRNPPKKHSVGRPS
jgi:hypothetical protein